MGHCPEAVRRLSCHRILVASEILVLETANVPDDDDDITYLLNAKSLQTARRHKGGVKV
jgi:hypothetical protein